MGFSFRQASAHITNSVQHIVGDIYNFVDTEVATIKAKTDNLPADPASNTAVNTRASQESVDDVEDKIDDIAAQLEDDSQSVSLEDINVEDLPYVILPDRKNIAYIIEAEIDAENVKDVGLICNEQGSTFGKNLEEGENHLEFGCAGEVTMTATFVDPTGTFNGVLKFEKDYSQHPGSID